MEIALITTMKSKKTERTVVTTTKLSQANATLGYIQELREVGIHSGFIINHRIKRLPSKSIGRQWVLS